MQTQKPQTAKANLPQPKITGRQLANIARMLYQKFQKEERNKKYASIKLILSYLAKGGYVVAALAMPGLGRLAPQVFGTSKEWQSWKRYNPAYLRRALQRLQQQKWIEVGGEGDKTVIKITGEGCSRILKYALDEMQIRPSKLWDGKWRLIIYDVSAKKRYWQSQFRQEIKRLGLYQLQKSVFITPYECQKEIDFLREYFGIGNEVLYLTVNRFEHDRPYREYFGLE